MPFKVTLQVQYQLLQDALKFECHCAYTGDFFLTSHKADVNCRISRVFHRIA